MLTKSLHTITAATNVAAELVKRDGAGRYARDGYVLAHAALLVLGHDINGSLNDPTVQRIVKNCCALPGMLKLAA